MRFGGRWSPQLVESLRIGMFCALVALAVLVTATLAVPQSVVQNPGKAYAPAYLKPTDKLQVRYDLHDGQAFAALAMDPLLRRPHTWAGGNINEAYRAGRPLVGWITWAGSLGQPGAVEWVLAALSILSIGFLGFATSRFARFSDRKADWSILVLVVPGALVSLIYPGLSDPLGAAFAILGLCHWRTGRRTSAVVLLVLAALSRDTCILVAVALAIDMLIDRRPLREIAPLSIPVLVYLGWITVVRFRLGVWPTAYPSNLVAPFTGLLREMRTGWSASGAVAAALLIGLLIAALMRRPPRFVVVLIACFILLALCGGAPTWHAMRDGIARSLLPAEVVALVVLLPRLPIKRRVYADGSSDTA